MNPEQDPHQAAARQEVFAVDGPVTLGIDILAGRVEVHCTDTNEVHVAVEPLPGNDISDGISRLLNWVGEQVGEHTGSARAVANMTIELDNERVSVRSTRDVPDKLVPLAVTITAPAESMVTLRSGGAALHVDGPCAGADVRSGSGELRFATLLGDAELQSGTGAIHVGVAQGRVRARTGAGTLSVDEITQMSTLITGGGDVRVGTVAADLLARTGHGDITVGKALSGELELQSATGSLRVGVPAGTLTELDLHGVRGRISSELDISADRPETTSVVTLRGRTHSGKITLVKA